MTRYCLGELGSKLSARSGQSGIRRLRRHSSNQVPNQDAVGSVSDQHKDSENLALEVDHLGRHFFVLDHLGILALDHLGDFALVRLDYLHQAGPRNHELGDLGEAGNLHHGVEYPDDVDHVLNVETRHPALGFLNFFSFCDSRTPYLPLHLLCELLQAPFRLFALCSS